uniref:(northern house mosquito) hypothetical protein n=1 Tax=Culex pipiens TaxID=7175 RepID=A0A8D8KG75_CULPI
MPLQLRGYQKKSHKRIVRLSRSTNLLRNLSMSNLLWIRVTMPRKPQQSKMSPLTVLKMKTNSMRLVTVKIMRSKQRKSELHDQTTYRRLNDVVGVKRACTVSSRSKSTPKYTRNPESPIPVASNYAPMNARTASSGTPNSELWSFTNARCTPISHSNVTNVKKTSILHRI